MSLHPTTETTGQDTQEEVPIDPAPSSQGGEQRVPEAAEGLAKPAAASSLEGAGGGVSPAPAPPIRWTEEEVDLAARARESGVSDESIRRWLGKPAGVLIPSRPRDVAPRRQAAAPRPAPPIRTVAPRKPRPVPWSEVELGVAATAWSEGIDLDVIAGWIGRSSAQSLRHLLVRHGVIPRERVKPPNWTAEDDEKLETWFRRGVSKHEMARRLGRTETAIRVRLKRIKPAGLVQLRPRTMRQVALLMGVDSKAVALWCDQGGLRFRWGWETPAHGPEGRRKRHGRVRLITEEQLTEWLQDESTWHLWRIERITDDGWREFAEDLRSGGDDVWLTTGEAAARLGVGHAAVNDWIHRGLFNGRQRNGYGHYIGPRRTGNGGNWLLNLHDVEDFRAPIDIPDPNALSTRAIEVMEAHGAGCFELEEGEDHAVLASLQKAFWYAARKTRRRVSTRLTPTALYFVVERAS